jgi:hypothetical protein
MQAKRGKGGVENGFGRLVTGCVSRHRQLGRGLERISVSVGYATRHRLTAPEYRQERQKRFQMRVRSRAQGSLPKGRMVRSRSDFASLLPSDEISTNTLSTPPKDQRVQPGHGKTLGTVRAGFETDPHDRRNLLVCLPVVGKLLLKQLQQVDTVRMDGPCSPTAQGNVLDMGIDALEGAHPPAPDAV